MDLLTTGEAASHLEVSPSRVRHYVAQGRLTSVKRGRDLFIPAHEVAAFQRHKRGPKPRQS